MLRHRLSFCAKFASVKTRSHCGQARICIESISTIKWATLKHTFQIYTGHFFWGGGEGEKALNGKESTINRALGGSTYPG